MRIAPRSGLTLAVFLGCMCLAAQDFQLTPRSAAVEVDGRQLVYPFAGGLNKPQASAIDFDNDGREDLFLFDRDGDAPLAFRRLASGHLHWEPSMLRNFPALKHWVMLRDYNGDGIEDIFAYSDVSGVPGIMVYRGYYDSDNLIAFQRVQFPAPHPIIYFQTNSGGQLNLYVTNVDYPAIDDVDCDGDLDILTFNQSGGYVEWYQNQSVEQGYGLDSLHYRLVSNCWCGFFESGLSASLDLAAAPGACAQPFGPPDEQVGLRHAGSTLLTFDEDGDGDKDLLLGDLSFPSLVLASNGGDCEQCWTNQQDESFPSYDTPAYLPLFPASFYVDVDDDGRRDLLAATNDQNYAADYECFWWYRNIGTDAAPEFSLQTRSFLLEEMIDMGTSSFPALLDYNADGLLDIVVGNFSYYQELNAKDTRLHLYENVGTATNPAFRLVDDDFLEMNQFGTATFNLAPTFGDLDGDGDDDALIGEQFGRLFYAENLAGPGQPVQFGPVQYNYMDLHVGQASAPEIADLNRDGLPDIILGQNSGFINYFQNQGTADEPFFEPDENTAPNIKQLGGVNASIPGFSTGYSVPRFLDFNGSFMLFMGTRFGDIEIYDQIDGNLNGAFNLVSADFDNIQVGSNLTPVFADLDNDGLLDLLVGNDRGGLNYFETNLMMDGTVEVTPAPAASEETIVYPNPTRDILYLENRSSRPFLALTVVNAQGQIWRRYEPRQATTLELHTADWSAGVYWLLIRTEAGLERRRVVVLR